MWEIIILVFCGLLLIVLFWSWPQPFDEGEYRYNRALRKWLRHEKSRYASWVLGRAIDSTPVLVSAPTPKVSARDVLDGLYKAECDRCSEPMLNLAVTLGVRDFCKDQLSKLRSLRMMRETRLRKEMFDALLVASGGVLHIHPDQRMIFFRDPEFQNLCHYYNSETILDHEIGLMPTQEGRFMRICASATDPVTPGVDEAFARLEQQVQESEAEIRQLALDLGLDPEGV